MTTEDKRGHGDAEAEKLQAILNPHLPLGSEWQQAIEPMLDEKRKPYIGPKSPLAQVVEQLDLMARQWPQDDCVLLVPDFTPDHYTVHYMRGKNHLKTAKSAGACGHL
ncbi:hypothetical protein LFT48_00355 [Arthrobacter sp. FW305-123]|nr:hypothetical protein LFT48_00355 [Arthrobacter sp. FW305-123]